MIKKMIIGSLFFVGLFLASADAETANQVLFSSILGCVCLGIAALMSNSIK